MRVWMGAAALAVMISGTAAAQTAAPAPAIVVPASRCEAFPPAPAPVPDGATATAEQMRVADAAMQAWDQATRAVMECRRAEVQEYAVVVATSNARVAEFNDGVRSHDAAAVAWTAEANEYNTLHPARGRRSR